MPGFDLLAEPRFWVAAPTAFVAAAIRGFSGVAFVIGGIFTAEVMALSLVLFPIYAIGIFIGGRLFGLASEATYRRIAYGSILFVAVAAMPAFG